MMDQELKKRWVEALRSGEYQQGDGVLKDDPTNTFCCLGVLMDIQGCNWEEEFPDVADRGTTQVPRRYSGGIEQQQTARLANRNDGSAGQEKHTFAEIADLIEDFI